MRYEILAFLLLLSACAPDPIDPQTAFADTPSATLRTNIDVLITIEDGPFAVESFITTRSVQMFDRDRYQQIEEYTESIGNASRTRVRGVYRDDEGMFLHENGSWARFEPSAPFDIERDTVREPIVRLSEHLSSGKMTYDPARSSEGESVYLLDDAHQLFDARIGEGEEGTVTVHDATITFESDDGMPRTVMINATVTSSSGTSRMDILMERTFESIGSTIVTRIDP